jgi:rhodanese-related sulfurtransferase
MRKFILVLFSLISFAAFSSQEIILVDVREAEEVRDGMLKGAVWYPLSKMQNDLSWKDEFIKMSYGKENHLYCRSGKRATVAQEILKKVGLESKNLGGYEDLRRRRNE